MRDRVYFEDVTCVAVGERAIRVDIDDKLVWIPLTQIDDESEVKTEGDEGRLVITKFIADQRELEGLEYDG